MRYVYLALMVLFKSLALSGGPLNVWIEPSDDTLFICQDNEVTLYGYFNGGIPPYTWYWTGNLSYINDPFSQTVVFTGSVPGTFKLWFNVRDGNNVTRSDSVVIVVKPKPNLSISGPSVICQGQSATLTASGATTYFWFNENGNLIGIGNPFNASPSSTTQYTLVGVKNGCANSMNYTLNVVLPPVAFAGPSDTICEGDNFLLSQASASNYNSLQWTTSGDGSFSNPTILQPTYYPGANDIANGSVTLTLTASGTSPCADATSSLVLTIQALQAVTISGDSVLCEGDSGLLSASAGTNFYWNTGQTTSSIIINPSSSSWYSVTATLGACVSRDSIWVQVKPKPVVSIAGQMDMCLGDSTVLQASGAQQYFWNTGDTLPQITVSPLSSTTYVVTGTENGCSNTASLQVHVHSPPQLSLTSDTAICLGESILIEAGGALYYQWSTGETSSSITVAPITTTNYYVTASDDYCHVVDSVQVTVKPLPIINLGSDTIICPGDGLWLQAGVADSYNWSTGSTSSSIYVSLSSSTTYAVTVTVNGCSASDEIQVDVKTLPPIIITPDTTLCQPSLLTLLVSGGEHYQWTTGDTTSQIQVFPATTTMYGVQVFVNGCTVWKFVTVTILNLPQLTISGPAMVCEGNEATLVASGASSYLWSTGETTSSIVVQPANTTTYYLTASEAGCTAIDSFTVQIQPIPVVELGNDTIICPNSNLTLNAGTADAYLWSTGQTTQSIVVSPANLTYYEVTVTINGCSNTDGIWVDVYNFPLTSVTNDTFICEGSSVILTAAGGDSYFWSTGEMTPSIQVSPVISTTYYVTITSGFCSKVDSVFVGVNPLPDLSDESINVCEGNLVTLYPGMWNSYLWSNGTTSSTQTFQPNADTTVWVMVTDANACSALKYYFIDVTEKPVLSLQPLYHACAGQPVGICVSGADAYLWSNGLTDSCITFLSPVSTMLYVQGTRNGCSTLDSTFVWVHPAMQVDLPGQVYLIEGDSMVLCGIVIGDSVMSMSWFAGSQLIATGNACVYISPDSTTIYYLTGYSLWGCSGIDSTIVNVFPPGIYANMMNDTTVCSGDSLQLWVHVYLSSSNNLHYQWFPAEGLSNDTMPNPMWYASESRWFMVTITDDEGHAFEDSVYITVIKRPQVYLGNDTAVCFGTTLTFADNNLGQHIWHTGDTSNSIVVTITENMWISLLVNNQGCIGEDSVFVNVITPPLLNVGPDRAVCQGESVPIPIFTGQDDQYMTLKDFGFIYITPQHDTVIHYVLNWNGCLVTDQLHITVYPVPAFDLQTSTSSYLEGQPVLINVVPSAYELYYFFRNNQLVDVNSSGYHYYDDLAEGDVVRVIVENEFGCKSERTWQGLLRHIPTAFTPNHNGQNDRFLPGVHQKIFNRWGQLLYEGSEGWDGTYQGSPVSEGTYYYLIEFINTEKGSIKTYTGSVLLIR